MTDFQTNLLTGLAADLDAAGIGTWEDAYVYGASDVAIVLGNIPQAPDNVITLTAYGVSDSPNLSTSVIGVQVRCRTAGQDKRVLDDLTDSIFYRWHGRTTWTLSTGVFIVQCLRNSGPASLGQDQNNRWADTSNYYVTVHRPSANRT